MGVLKVSIDLGPEEGVCRYYPSKAALTSRLDELAENMYTVLNNAPRLSLPSAAELPLSAGELLHEDEKMLTMRGKIREIVAEGYRYADEYGVTFEKYRELYSFVTSFDAVVYSANNPTFEKLSNDLDQLGKWTKDIGRMRLERNVTPLVMVEARKFKQIVERCNYESPRLHYESHFE